MAEKLRFVFREYVNLRGVSGSHIIGAVLYWNEDQTIVHILALDYDPPGVVVLEWDGEQYVSWTNRKPVQVDKQLLVKARLKKLKSDDGIMELREETVYVGKQFMLDANSISDSQWGHRSHPGKSWTRTCAVVYAVEEGPETAANVPVEFFDIEAQA